MWKKYHFIKITKVKWGYQLTTGYEVSLTQPFDHVESETVVITYKPLKPRQVDILFRGLQAHRGKR